MTVGLAGNAAIGIIGLILLSLIHTLGSAIPFIAMLCLALGGCVASLGTPMLTGKCFGNKDFGAIYGLGNTLFMAGCMIGPMLSAAIREGTGNYITAWIIYMCIYAGIFVFGALALKKSPLSSKK